MSDGILVQLIVDTLAAAALYAIVALAVALAFSGTGIVALAIGQVAVAGALVAASMLANGVPLWLAIAAGLAVGAALSALAERGLVASTLGRPLLGVVLLVAAGVVLQELLGGFFPRPAYAFPSPQGVYHVFGGIVRLADLVTIATVIVAGLAGAAVLGSARFGAPLRITSAAPHLAERLGVDTALVRTVSFAIGGVLATGAVLLATNRFPLTAAGGSLVALRGIAAAAAGRMTSRSRIAGAALLIGAAEVVGQYALGGGGEFLCDAMAILLVAVGWRR